VRKILIFGQAEGVHLLKWIKPFKKKYEIFVVTFHPPRDLAEFEDCHFYSVPRITGTKLDYFLSYFKVKQIFRDIDPDLIHVHYISSYGVVAAWAAAKYKKIVTIWGSDLLLARNNPILRFLIDKALFKFDWVNVPSEFAAEILYKIGLSPSKVGVFQYGIDVEECERYKVEKSEYDIRLFSNRMWGEVYNIDLIINAFKLAYEKNKSLVLVLAGGGDEQTTKRIRSLCEGHPAIKIAGMLPRKELLQELWRSQLFISVPKSDGMPLSVLEACYCACFPILSDLPPNREILENGVGIIDSTLTVESLSEAILSATEIFRKSDLNINRNFIDQKASYHKNMVKVENEYSKLLEI